MVVIWFYCNLCIKTNLASNEDYNSMMSEPVIQTVKNDINYLFSLQMN